MTDTGDSIESPPIVRNNATMTMPLSDLENITVTLESQATVSSGQVCITPPRYDTEPHNPQIYRSVYNGYQDMLDYNLDSDDEMDTFSVMVVDEARNLVPVTTESEASVQAEFVSCDEREVSQLVRLVEGGGNS